MVFETESNFARLARFDINMKLNRAREMLEQAAAKLSIMKSFGSPARQWHDYQVSPESGKGYFGCVLACYKVCKC